MSFGTVVTSRPRLLRRKSDTMLLNHTLVGAAIERSADPKPVLKRIVQPIEWHRILEFEGMRIVEGRASGMRAV